ncbi:MAG: hypothetical protein PHT69_10185 [Bacteroidales bacterium]|nr:hypothetical protein [Bacteroidales bacterium]
MMSTESLSDKIIKCLPYAPPFLFVDHLNLINETGVEGVYTFPKDAFFYSGHFVHKPVTPGVIMLECMGQIGMICHLVFLTKLFETPRTFHPLLSNVEAGFFKTVEAEELLLVRSHKIYYRKELLRSKVEMFNSKNDLCVKADFLLKFIFP